MRKFIFIAIALSANFIKAQFAFSLTEPKQVLFSDNTSLFFHPNTLTLSPNINYHILNKRTEFYTVPPKLAFFCRMEDRFRNKFNVYLKLRAGSDEEYMKMIGAGNK